MVTKEITSGYSQIPPPGLKERVSKTQKKKKGRQTFSVAESLDGETQTRKAL